MRSEATEIDTSNKEALGTDLEEAHVALAAAQVNVRLEQGEEALGAGEEGERLRTPNVL